MTEIVATYVHPQGKRIDVLANNGLVCTKNGKPATTSATAAKLAAGHGGWTLVTGDEAATAAAVAVPASVAAPAVTLRPMRFAEAPVTDLGAYVNDDAWALQQKLDGVRAQLVFEPGKAPWFRNSTGGQLVNSTVAPVANKILSVLAPHTSTSAGYVVDGEILQGGFYVFDLVVDGEEATAFSARVLALGAWHRHVSTALSVPIRLVPTAMTAKVKARLGFAVLNRGGEGWIAKRLDSPYSWGERVTHSVKLKVTSTVDCIVVSHDPVKDAVVLGALTGDERAVEIGRASTIGKGDLPVGSVVEVKYLYASADGRLTQPTILRRRDDKTASDCLTSQLRFVNKAVIEL